MATVLHRVRDALEDPSIPWQSVVLATGFAVTAFESWIGSVLYSDQVFQY